jgi:TonB family protein
MAFSLAALAEESGAPEGDQAAIPQKTSDKDSAVRAAGEEMIGHAVTEYVSKALWFPSYAIVSPRPEQAAKKDGLRGFASVSVSEAEARDPGENKSGSFKRHWPDATSKEQLLCCAWVSAGRITQVKKMRFASPTRQSGACFRCTLELNEEEKGGFPVVFLRFENHFLDTKPGLTDSPLERALRACVTDDPDTLAALLDGGLALNAEIEPGISLACCAALSNSVPCLEILKKRGANLEAISQEGPSPLELAAENGRTQAVTFLLASKVNTRTRHQKNRNALLRAASNGHASVVSALIAAKADPDEITNRNETPLVAAINANYPEVAELLYGVTRYIPMDSRDSGLVLLTLCRENKTEMVRFFLSKGANARFTDKGLSTLIAAAPSGSAELAQVLIKAGADVNWIDEDNNTALIMASNRGNVPFMRALLEAQADPNLQTKTGFTALHSAVYREKSDIVELLLAEGANCDASINRGITPFQAALLIGSRACAAPMAAKGATLDRKSPEFERNLESVILFDLNQVLERLLQAGLPPTAKLHDQWTLLEAAKICEAKACVALLEQYGAKIPDTPACRLIKASELKAPVEIAHGILPPDPRPADMKFPATKALAHCLVAPDGSPHFIEVQDCPDPFLRLAIREVLYTWRFTPPVAAEGPVSVRVSVPLSYASSKDRRPEKPKIDQMPVVLKQAKPIYPRNMLEAGGMANVTVSFTVNIEGNVENERVVRTSGESFNEPALVCVRKWRFKPALSKGVPVPCDMMVPIIFSITSE